MSPLLDTFLAAASRAHLPPAGPLYPQVARALAESLVAWGHRRPENLLLRGGAAGTGGFGEILPEDSRIQVAQRPAQVGRSPATDGLCRCAAAGIAAIVEGAQYAGTSAAVGLGTDESWADVVRVDVLREVVSQRLAANGLGGPAGAEISRALAESAGGIFFSLRGQARVRGSRSRTPSSGPTKSVLVLPVE